MKRVLLLALFLLIPTVVSAQATTTSRFEWDQAATTLAVASAYNYKYYPDGATTGVPLTSVTCTGTASPFVCTAPIPAFTPGNHSVTLSASNVAGESPKSSPVTFTFVVVPSTPAAVRVVP